MNEDSLSLNELSKIGGIEHAIKLLDSNNNVVRENASLVLANSTHESDNVCVELVKNINCLKVLVEHLKDTNDSVKKSVIRTIANLTCMDPEITGGSLISVLRNTGGMNILIKNLGSENNHFAKYSSIAIGNLTCEDCELRSEVQEKNGVKLLLSMIETPSLVNNGISALANVTYQNANAVQELISLNGVDTLMQIYKKYSKSQNLITEGVINILSNCGKENRSICSTLLNPEYMLIFIEGLDSRSELQQEYSLKALCSILTANLGSEYSKSARATIAKHGLITPFVLMLDHHNRDISTISMQALTALRCGDGEMLIPFLETGTTSVLFLLQHTSKDDTVKVFVSDMLDWLRGELCGPTLALLIRTLHLDGNDHIRGALSQSILCLAVGTPHIRSAFIHDGGLDAILKMLNDSNEVTFQACLDFLCSVEPIADGILNEFQRTNPLPKISIDAAIINKTSFNNQGTSNFTFLLENDARFYAHKEVLMGNTKYFKNWFESNPNVNLLIVPNSISYEIFEAIMKHIYFGLTSSLFENSNSIDPLNFGLKLLKAASFYELESLKRVCGFHCSKQVGSALSYGGILIAMEIGLTVSELCLCVSTFSSILHKIKNDKKSNNQEKVTVLLRRFVIMLTECEKDNSL